MYIIAMWQVAQSDIIIQLAHTQFVFTENLARCLKALSCTVRLPFLDDLPTHITPK
jgi:hypothetical protein